jgi:chromosome segregation ATPase
MSSLSSELEWAARLSGQLETLSELAESLTYRVLELEDRVARQDGQLSSLQEASDALSQGIGEGIEARMRDTDDRLARIEQLLQGEGTRGPYSRSLRAVPKARTDPHDLASSSDETEEQVVFLDDTLANFPGEMTDAEDPPFEEDPSLLDDLVDQSLAS